MGSPAPPGEVTDTHVRRRCYFVARHLKQGQHAHVHMGPLTWLAWLKHLLPRARTLSDVKTVHLNGVTVHPAGHVAEGHLEVASWMQGEAEPR